MGRKIVAAAVGLLLLLILAIALNHASSKVAFMGDSITQGWAFPRVNFGIHGETTAQMRARFRRQIDGQGYRTVVILGGTNDTLLHLDESVTLENLGVMVDLARQAKVEPVLSEIPPIYTGGGQHLADVARLDAGIIELAHAKHVRLIDYFDALDGSPAVFSDGTHLKRRGYARMEWALLRVLNPF